MRVQSPVVWVMNSIGFAPSPPIEALQISPETGDRHSKNTRILIHLVLSNAFKLVLLQKYLRKSIPA